MKTLFSIALVALIYFMHVYSDVHSAVHVLRQECCPSVSVVKFRDHRVTHVAYTSSCQKAIIVKNVCNQTFCVDANLTSAKSLLYRFTRAMANTTARSPFGKECKNALCRENYRCRT